MQPTYVVGDATYPRASGNKIVAHVVNDAGRWGAGFVLAISKRWPEPRASYVRWHGWHLRHGDGVPKFGLGEVQFVQVETDTWVANMVAQVGVGELNGPPIRYDALHECLKKVAEFAKASQASVHAPRIGCGLAGGSWSRVGLLVEQDWCDEGVGTFIYDLHGA